MPDQPSRRVERRTRSPRLRRRAALGVLPVGVLVAGWVALGVLDRSDSGSETLADVTGVLVEVEAGDVHVVGRGRPRVEIEVGSDWRASWRLVEPRTTRATTEDGRALVTSSCGTAVPIVVRCRVDHVVTAPRELPVEIRVGSGDVLVEGVPDVRVEVGHGSVRGTGITGHDVIVSTVGGDVTLELSRRPSRVEITTVGGDVELVVPGGPYHVEVSSGGGAVEVSVPTAVEAEPTITVASDGGDVLIRPPA